MDIDLSNDSMIVYAHSMTLENRDLSLELGDTFVIRHMIKS